MLLEHYVLGALIPDLSGFRMCANVLDWGNSVAFLEAFGEIGGWFCRR